MRAATLLALVAALAACERSSDRHRSSDRERDCAEVKKVLAQRVAFPPLDEQGNGIVDMSPYAVLRDMRYRDATVRDAANAAAADIAADVYSPGPDDGTPPSVDRLASLCGLSRAHIVVD